ncbi:MAG: membrane protein [Phycisphaerae bacterium]|nr:MAG: membrane protein [Phycisphaerae bacterium]
MIAARIFTSIVGIAYLGFSVWCTLQPQKTASSIGFELKPGSGQSEYLVVYGGLQLALGCIFLLPLLRPDFLRNALLICVIIHGSLVLFRGISIGLYGRLDGTTYVLSALELSLLVVSAILLGKE